MKKPKHVIWFICDQLRADYLGFMGNKIARTPNLDRLAGQGVIFDNMFVQNPACMASRGAMLTGRYPSTIRMANGSPYLDPREVTLPEILQRNNYKTGMFGKLHVTPQVYTTKVLKSNRTVSDPYVFMKDAGIPEIPGDPVKQNYGFQEMVGFEDGLWGEYMDWLREKDPKLLEEIKSENIYDSCSNRHNKDGTTKIPSSLHPSTFIAESAISYFEKNHQDNQCFMEVSFVDPHHPFDPPFDIAKNYNPADMPLPKHSETNLIWPQSLLDKNAQNMNKKSLEPENLKSIIARYHAMIEMIDISIGKVLDAVEKSGDFDDTLFVFIADHGEHLGSYGLLTKGYFHYDHLIRVPFFMSWKKGIEGNRRIEGLTEEIDVNPTISELLGVPVHQGVQGKSFAKALTKNQPWGKEAVNCVSFRAPSGPYIACLTVRTNKYKLNFYPEDNMTHLFDLDNDPDEINDLSSHPACQDKLKEMMNLLVINMWKQKDPLPIPLSQW